MNPLKVWSRVSDAIVRCWKKTKIEYKQKMPIGREFLTAIREQEDQSEAMFEEWTAAEVEIGSEDLLEKLGTALFYLDRVPRCGWGCEDNSSGHLEKHITARANSNARVALRLSMSGYLSEAFAITRSMGEIANLMHLFMESEDSLETYRNASVSSRNRHFSAGKVREKLDGLNVGSFMDRELYGNLSRVFVHTSANWSPLSHSVSGAPKNRNKDEKEGILTILMAVANWVSTTLTFANRVNEQPEDGLDALVANKELLDALGVCLSAFQEPL